MAVETVSVMVAPPDRPSASVTVKGIDLDPEVAFPPIVVCKEKIRSPDVTSPLVPSSKRATLGEPPMEVRSAETARRVLVGFAPGVTDTVSTVEVLAATEEGFAAPVPDGLV